MISHLSELQVVRLFLLVKTLDKIAIIKKKNIITLTFTARSFLYNQVRIMTGTLKDVGSGLINPIALKKFFRKKKGQALALLLLPKD